MDDVVADGLAAAVAAVAEDADTRTWGMLLTDVPSVATTCVDAR